MPHILIADDDPAVRSLLHRVLSKEGYCVETASDGRIAMEMVATALPDLLITDLLMPGLTGWSVFARARRQASQLPILLISGARTGVPPDTATLTARAVFLRKPIMIGQLLSAVAHLLDANQSTSNTYRENGR
jgi:DNA-binding response OmpR family regulator